MAKLSRFAPRIRTVLLIVNLVILFLPLFGIQALRLYESELIRQTEAALAAQGAYIREHYLAELLATLRSHTRNPAAAQDSVLAYGNPVDPRYAKLPLKDRPTYEPIQAELEITRERIRTRAEEPIPAPLLPEPAAESVGETLSPLLRRAQRYALTGVRIVDPRGVVVATTAGELGLAIGHREEVGRALKGESISLLRERVSDMPSPEVTGISRGGLVRVFLALPVVYENRVLGAIILSRTPMDIQKALYLNRFVLLRYISGLLLILLAVSLLTAITISRPLGALIDQTRRVKENAKAAAEPIAHPGSHEIRQLSHAIADMAKTLQARADYIQVFARNVSHEFKTPIAAIQAIVELFRDHLGTMSEAERSRFLDMLAADATRMQKLVERLLLLARADVAEPVTDATDVGRTLASTIDRFRSSGMDVELDPDRSGAGLSVRAAAETLDSLVANLIENARQHGGPEVKVMVGAEALPGRVLISIRDDGTGISPANQAKVFTPFFTTARDSGGTGLGLAIVRSLIEAHGGTITLTSPPPHHQRGVVVTLSLLS